MTAGMGRVRVFAIDPWWGILIEGVTALVLGLLLLAAPGQMLLLLVQLLGIFWLIGGVMSLVSLAIDRHMWGWKLFSGVIGVLAGFAVINHPLWSAVAVPAVLVIYLAVIGIVFGAVRLYQAFRGAGWGSAILGVLSIIFGLVLLASPLIAVSVLPFVLGFWGVVGGVAAIWYALQQRPHARQVEREARPAA